MAYASVSDIADLYPDTGEAAAALAAAERDIDGLTYGRIRQKGFENLTDFQQALIREATIGQVGFRQQYADMLACPLSSYGINGVSMAFDGGRLVTAGGAATTTGIYGLLRQTGLTFRGVP